MHTGLTFITNEKGKRLKYRFDVLIKDSQFFDCLVGYFYSSGFYSVYESLKNTEKIRILAGISTDKKTFELFSNFKEYHNQSINFSHAETKQVIGNMIEKV